LLERWENQRDRREDVGRWEGRWEKRCEGERETTINRYAAIGKTHRGTKTTS
jgi:hypothetical protein